MPTIYDNIELCLLDGLRKVMQEASAADFCVGYLNLCGWGRLADLTAKLPGTDDGCCRILVGMQRLPDEEAREAYRAIRRDEPLDPPTIRRLQREAAEAFRTQLQFGVPTNQAEADLRLLAQQLRTRKARVKLFLPYPLHAKLYLVHRPDTVAPLVGYVGSSNLTLAGLCNNGELNIDVLDQDAAEKLHDWFLHHWEHQYCVEISDDLAALIEESWAAERLVRPYLVYLKMAYHISNDARLGENEFRLPRDLQGRLLDFQTAAVSLAARHLQQRGGVLVGDVVGLGKTFVAAAVARILQEDEQGETLIICPPSLVAMWEGYVQDCRLIGTVLSLAKVQDVLPELRRYKLVVIDESHNLRNREGARYRAIREYIERNECRCLLVTATPYNKQYSDMSNQLRLFVDEKRDLGLRPERYFDEVDERDFVAQHQASPRSLMAFERSDYADDWRDLMRLYMVRRTRRFIMENYAKHDPKRDRFYVLFPNGERSYFPKRLPHNLVFALDEGNPADQYARLYSPCVVSVINRLYLPRYGLAEYLCATECEGASKEEKRILDDLGRAGRRLLGYCRTNLFKRLESSGHSFLLSLHRHILRNMITLHALENGLHVPIGTQDAGLLDTAITDQDETTQDGALSLEDGPQQGGLLHDGGCPDLRWFRQRAATVYEQYCSPRFKRRFRWLRPELFRTALAERLLTDASALCDVMQRAGPWDPEADAKLAVLADLLSGSTSPAGRRHARDKVLVFTQFADTAAYLGRELRRRGITDLETVTGDAPDPTALSRRFSPKSNNYCPPRPEDELRVLVATDVLSEGQNLQDCHVVVNYDLPWAIIRLIQRAGRVDRIGQTHGTIHVYSFVPAQGVEHIIRLHKRLRQRLQESSEVVGTDERFFDERCNNKLRDIYTERSGALDDADDDDEVDLASQALQVWLSASEVDRKAALELPPKVHATRPHTPDLRKPAGALVYLRSSDGMDTLVRVDTESKVVSQSLSGILRDAACQPETPALPRDERHHDWVASAVEAAYTDENLTGGRLGPPRSARRRAYERLRAYFTGAAGSLFATKELERAIDAIYKYRLTSRAQETLSRQLRLRVPDETLADIVVSLHKDDRLVVAEETAQVAKPNVICSMGLMSVTGEDANADRLQAHEGTAQGA